MANDFAERKALAVLEAWERATAPHDPKWRKLYAEAAIAAGLPFFTDAMMGDDLGAAGWRAWAVSNE